MDWSINIEPWVVIVGALTPFLTAVAAKLNTPDWWKGLLSITWAAIAGIVGGFVDAPSGFDWSLAWADGAGVWSTHLLTWLGISAAAVDKLHVATAQIGLGKPE